MSQGIHLRKYGVEATIDFDLYEVDGVDLRTDWVPAAADCEVMKDGGASTQCTNTATDEGSTYSIVLTATEMQAARIVLKVVDAATKVFLDKVVMIETYGHGSAQHALDLDMALASQTIGTCTANTDMVGTNSAALASVCTETRLAELDAANLPTDIAAIPTTAMRGTDSAALASVCTEARLAELAAANLPTDIAAIPTTAMRGTDSAALASVCTETRLAELDAANIPTDIAAVPTVDEVWAKAMSDLAQGAPSATASVLTAINYLYEAWRNKITTTATLITVMKDDGTTGLVKSIISDDATTFSKGEMITGA